MRQVDRIPSTVHHRIEKALQHYHHCYGYGGSFRSTQYEDVNDGLGKTKGTKRQDSQTKRKMKTLHSHTHKSLQTNSDTAPPSSEKFHREQRNPCCPVMDMEIMVRHIPTQGTYRVSSPLRMESTRQAQLGSHRVASSLPMSRIAKP